MKNSNEQMREAIREALDSYHITQQTAVDDTGFFLVDALTPSWETSIEKGQLELDSLADHIFDALPPETTHASIAEKYKGLVEAAKEVVRVKSTLPRCENYIDILADALAAVEAQQK